MHHFNVKNESKKNCHNAEKVLSFVTTSGKQEFTVSFQVICCFVVYLCQKS